MTSMKTFGLAIAIAFVASSFALAQQGSPAANQSGSATARNAAASNVAASRTMHRTGSARTGGHTRNGLPPVDLPTVGFTPFSRGQVAASSRLETICSAKSAAELHGKHTSALEAGRRGRVASGFATG
jgi:hypothetical protein